KSNDSRFVRLDVDGGFLQEASVITVNTEDEYGHASQIRTFNVTPQAIVRLDQSLMSIPGYVSGSNAGTIGYSSQESKGEGAVNGRITCILDGDTKTFWHASWKEVSNYPHWFIVDLGKDYKVANVELTRRIGDSRGQKGQTVSTCSDAGAPDKSNPEGWAWTVQGTYPFDSTSDSPQTVDLSAKLPTARYIKVYFGTEMKGGGNYAMLSEFNVYIVE
ncbi:MAG: discoidin domain-containing protein, partial [Prevotella sp.]